MSALPDGGALALFVPAALALLVIPGPAVLYIVAQSIDQGRLAGIASVAGVATGSLVHVTAASLGLSALLLSSALAFSVVKYVGAAYLIFLGLRKLLGRDAIDPAAVRAPRRLGRLFRQGVVVNVLNPKTALFFFAFLPQFVDASEGRIAVQIAALGVLFVLLGLLSDGLWALVAGTAAGWLRGNARVMRAQRYVSGGVFIGLGVATAFSGSKRSA